MKYLFFLVFTIHGVVAQSPSQLLEEKIQEILNATGTPGASVAIVSEDTLLLCKGFGYRDIEKKLKVNKHTLFSIGSSSKAFTAALIGIANDKDSVDIDDSPQRYLNQLKFYNEEMNNGVTVRDLLGHRTGLPRHDLSWYLFPHNNTEKLVARMEYLEPFTALRQEYHYNNFAYMVLGALAEKALGAQWAQLIGNHIFSPLKMNRSTTAKMTTEIDNTSLGYRTSSQGKVIRMDYYDLKGMIAAGGINSSAYDMANWVKCWLNAGEFEKEQVLPPGYIVEAMSSQTIMRANLPDHEFKDLFFSNYGFGWMLSSYKGHYRVEHGGNINGFSANVCFFPAESLGMVILTNQNNSDAPYLIRNTISDHLLGSDKTDWLAYHKKENKKITEASPTVPRKVKKFTSPPIIEGSYVNKGYGKITIQKDSLGGHSITFPIGTFKLVRTGTEQFKMLTDGNITTIDPQTVPELILDFTLNEKRISRRMSIAMEPKLAPIDFVRDQEYKE